MYELGWRSSKQATGTPIKKLLAEEMSRETESRKKSPGVIARLMGFDGLPPQQLAHKQQKRSSDNYLQRVALSERSLKSSTSCSRRSPRRSSKEEQEFKDVFEVLDMGKMETNTSSLQGTANSKLTEAEMAFVKQKFLDVTRLSTDEKFHDSKEFHDAVDDLDSNKDLLLKFLEQPDSLFKRHLHDLRAAPSSPHCSHVSGMKLSRASEYEGRGLGCNREIETTWKYGRKNHSDPLSHSCSKRAAHDPPKSSKIQVESKVDSSVIPTRIVVLKPNFGKVQNASRTVSSPRTSYDFLSDCDRQMDLPSTNGESELCGSRRFPNDVGLPRYKSRESREIAKEITRQMRNSIESGSLNPSTSGFRGYAGDESSSNRSDNESANESDGPTVISRNAIGWSNRYRPSSSRSAESSVSREARKRLSERWKMTHRSVDMGVASRGSTLGEMLALPDREGRPANADAMVNEKGCSHKLVSNDRPTGWVEPLGISSRDGWKDECIRSLSRSRSVPASFTTGGSPKIGMRPETLCKDSYLLPKEVTKKTRIKSVKVNFNQREGSSSRNSRSHFKRSHFSEGTCSDQSEVSPEICFSSKQVQTSISKDNLFEQFHKVSETSATAVTDVSFIPEKVVDVAIENVPIPSEPTDPELPSFMLLKGNPSTSGPEVANSQEQSNALPAKGSVPAQRPATELASLESSKEAEQPSPVSVLETPFPDDLSSSSECFESLCADLHGLRMQLQLLKLESEAYAEGPMLISSDEDLEEGSVGTSEEKGKPEESREFSYVVDVLLESGISDADPNTFMASWHSSECPVNSVVFEELEKKHCYVKSWPRSERKLLFDRINSALLVINQQFADPHPWVRPATAIASRWIKNGLEDGIHELLANQDMKANKDAAEKALVMDLQWLDLRDNIDIVGRDIEGLLIEELLKEIAAV
ncbi:uncharacterized protein LOC8278099 isoform X2 [Ricinus communis]|nr:uncharacterized protein LOC8278099 isoform X2 [Ricinus communis]